MRFDCLVLCLIKLALLQVQEMYAAALAEDPSVFDYDGVYDKLQQVKVVPKQQDKISRQPRYIASLVEQAQVRKKEQDIAYERRLVSGAVFGPDGSELCYELDGFSLMPVAWMLYCGSNKSYSIGSAVKSGAASAAMSIKANLLEYVQWQQQPK